MKKIIVIIIPMLITVSSFSQSTELNLDKYWNYRNRLKSKFLVSENHFRAEYPHHQGLNIPASIYNPSDYGYNSKTLSWGDATSHLGYYLAVLATEYSLLKMYGQDYTGTVNELIWSLATIERLDHRAELYYGGSCPEGYTYENTFIYIYPYDDACFNGFFVRDDIPSDFLDYWKNKGYTAFNGLETVSSDSQDLDDFSDNEMSQDQVWDLMFGLALVKKLVDLPNTFYDGDGEQVNLKKWAQKITYRLVKFMHADACLGQIWEPCGLFEGCWPGHWVDVFCPAWAVINPQTGNFVSRGGLPEDCLATGYYFAEAGNWITDKQFGDLHYHEAAEPIFVGSLIVFPKEQFYGANSMLTLSTISKDAWGGNVDAILGHCTTAGPWFNSSIPDNKNDCKLFAFEHYPMYSIALHDEIPDDHFFDYYMSFIKNLLNLAPTDGPFRYIYDIDGNGVNDENDYPNREWATDNRIWKPIGVSLEYGEIPGEYNGLDYMILHNLYWLTYNKVYNKKITVSTTLPYSHTVGSNNITIGENSDETTMNISSLLEIEANNIIEANGKVVYKAGSTITLLPGFNVKNGASFRAYIDNFDELSYEYSTIKNSSLMMSSIDTMPTSNPINYRKKRNKVTIIENIDLKDFELFPNPSTSIVNIRISDRQKVHSIEIYNSNGVLVDEIECIDKELLTIDISNYSNGLHFIQILTDDGLITKKFIKK